MKKSILKIIVPLQVIFALSLFAGVCNTRLVNITTTVCNQKVVSSPAGEIFDAVRGDITGRCTETRLANYKITPSFEQLYQYTYADIEHYSNDPNCTCPATQQRQCVYEIKVGEPVYQEFLNWQSCVGYRDPNVG